MSTICLVDSAAGITSSNIVLYESCIRDWNSGNCADGTPARVASDTRYSPEPRELSERRLSYDDTVNTCRRFFARTGFWAPPAPGVVLEVKSVTALVISAAAAVVPLVMSVVATKGASNSSVVAFVMHPYEANKTPMHRTARQSMVLICSS